MYEESNSEKRVTCCIHGPGKSVKIQYAVIADGPFKTPEGYRICSTAVYIQYSPAMTTKPFSLIHTHSLVWCSRPPSQAKSLTIQYSVMEQHVPIPTNHLQKVDQYTMSACTYNLSRYTSRIG